MPDSLRQRKLRSVWDERVDQWSDTVDTSPAFARLRDRMLELSLPAPTDRCLDLGAGTGFLTLPLAGRVAHVTAVDLSAGMMRNLAEQAAKVGSPVTTQVADMAQLQQPPVSYDLIVSSYAMHYLADPDKHALLGRMHSWLVPGGRLVISDMMVGRKLDEHHRKVLWEKALTMLRRGPAGWWRLVKNLVRIGSGKGRLRPCPPDWWLAAVAGAGFADVRYEHVISEAGIVTASKPATASDNGPAGPSAGGLGKEPG